MLFVLLAFMAVFRYADNLRAKLALEYAAFRCARARTVGYNDYKILKTARLATMSVAGECLVEGPDGTKLSTGSMAGRMSAYLSSRNDGEAGNILDFEHWADDVTFLVRPKLSGSEITVEVDQRRPQAFSVEDGERALLRGECTMEAHYPSYLSE